MTGPAVASTAPSVRDPTGGGSVVELGGVTVRFDGITALDGVDLTVGRGERIALVGPSGAGKTTLLNVIAGLTEPTSGQVSVGGRRLGQLSGRALRRHRADVGLVGQSLDLALPLRVVHNVNAGLLGSWSTPTALVSLLMPRGRSETEAVLDQVGLADRADDRTDELSGGERQRVAVARVLRQRPKLVLADEPTSSVDPRLSDVIMALLSPSGDGPSSWTTIVSVHDPDLGRRHVDRMIGLRTGRVVFDLPAGDVDDDMLAALYRDR